MGSQIFDFLHSTLAKRPLIFIDSTLAKRSLIFIDWTKPAQFCILLLILFLWHSHAMSASLLEPLEPLEELGIGRSGGICYWAEIFAMFCGV
jgi:hypothetical protein